MISAIGLLPTHDRSLLVDVVTPKTVAVGGGRIGLGHRPKKSVLPELRRQGFTHVVTLLGEREGSAELIKVIVASGLISVWLPLENGEPVTDIEKLKTIRSTFEVLEHELGKGAELFFHCSAGIHRTGMIVNAFLIYLGVGPDEALALLGQLRSVTEAGVTARRLEWGHQFNPTQARLRQQE